MLSSIIETSTAQSTAYANRRSTLKARLKTTLAHGITWKLSCGRCSHRRTRRCYPQRALLLEQHQSGGWPPPKHRTARGAGDGAQRAGVRDAGTGRRARGGARSAVINCDRALRPTLKASPPSKCDSSEYFVSRASARVLRP